MEKVYYYKNYDEDIIKSKNQDYKLKDNYKWIHKNIFYIVISYLAYYIVLIIAFIYVYLILKVRIKNKEILKRHKSYFIYGNHTQMLGDVLSPFVICFPHRPYIVCSASNLGIPVIGRILPICGALVIPEGISATKRFMEGVSHYSKNHPIIIYPESHLWPYATFIRNFNRASFHFIESNSQVFTATTTYQKGKRTKPNITIYLDSIKIDNYLSKQEKSKDIEKKVKSTMEERSKLNNWEYIKYQRKE